MEQLLSTWNALDTRRRIVVIGATVAMFAAVFALSRIATQPSMSLLYAGLEPTAAGEIVAALDQQGVTYDVRGGSIFVDANQRDSLRLTLASEGLPSNSGQGYELLDNLTGFGTTSQMFDAAYWRAKEGELARTLSANPAITHARVHISNQPSSPFQRGQTPTASVSVTPSGNALVPAQAKAIRYLVASAVSGMAPMNVTVIDGRTGLVIGDDDPLSLSGSTDRAQELRGNIERILEARVGAGNAVVEVAVETFTEREAIVERRFDPENRVAISSDTEERTTVSSGTQGGGVTVASNLPDGDAAVGGNSNQSENSETRQRFNYEVSETTREVVRNPGAIKKISVAVLVNGQARLDDATGETVFTPRDEGEIESLRELVASSVGLDEARGDTITIKSMEFQATTPMGSAPSVPFLQSLNIDAMSLIQLAVLSIVAIALGLFVIKPILAGVPVSGPPALAAPEDIGVDFTNGMTFNSAVDPSEFAEPGAPLTGEIDDGPGPQIETAMFGEDDFMSGGGGSLGVSDDPVDRLRNLIDERKDETMEVLRSWMEEENEEKV